MNTQFALEKWSEIKQEILKRISSLKEEDIEKTKGNLLALIQLVEQKSGLSREHAKKLVADVLIKFGAQDFSEKFQRKAIEMLSLTTMVLDGIKYNIQKDLDDKEKAREESMKAAEEVVHMDESKESTSGESVEKSQSGTSSHS